MYQKLKQRAVLQANTHTQIHTTQLFATPNRHIQDSAPTYPSVTFSEINHSAPICETSERKISNSANMTPRVTQKSGIFVTEYAKTPLANYLLLLK